MDLLGTEFDFPRLPGLKSSTLCKHPQPGKMGDKTPLVGKPMKLFVAETLLTYYSANRKAYESPVILL
jgi:hypothetical protein